MEFRRRNKALTSCIILTFHSKQTDQIALVRFEDDIMKSVYDLKRQNTVNYNLCLFCQRRKDNDKLREASEQGLSTLKEAIEKIFQFGEHDEVIDRVVFHYSS